MATQSVLLLITPGLPFRRRIRVEGAKTVWPQLDSFEARSHVRVAKDPTSALAFDFTPYLSKEYDGDDILITLSLTGAQARLVNPGYYDMVLSDPGITDARAIPILSGRVKLGKLLTGASNV